MRALFNLLLNIPWWGFLVALAGLVIAWQVFGFLVRRKFDQIVHETVLAVGSSLKGARAVVYSAKAVPPPAWPSPYDLDKDDENFDEDLDGQAWNEDGYNFYAIDVAISPADPLAKWDPTALTLVPADFKPDDPTEVSEHLCGLHSAELFTAGRFVPAPESQVTGSQRVRLLFAVHEGKQAMKFAMFVTYFGQVDLPAPVPKQTV